MTEETPGVNGAQMLSDLTVLEWGQGLAASYAAKLLADLGAQVIHVDDGQPKDPHRSASGEIRRYLEGSRRRLRLDLNSAGDRADFLARIASADVLIEDHPPGEAAALGLDFPSLSTCNPLLVMTSITPFGQTGPYRNYRGNDLIVSFMSGLAHLTPRDIARVGSGRGQPPLKMPGSLVSFYAGITAAGATLTAIRGRRSFGRGRHVDISMVESLIPTIRREIALYRYENRVASRFMRVWRLAPWGVKRCSDGYVFLQVAEEHHWRGLVEMMGNPEWARDPQYLENMYRYEHRHEIEDRLQPWLLSHTKAEITREAQQRSVPFAPVNTLADFTSIPQLQHRRFFRPGSGQETRTAMVPGLPYRFTTSRPSPPPDPGLQEEGRDG